MLCGDLEGRRQLEQVSHTWLDIVLNDKKYIKKPEMWEVIRGGMGKLWRICLGRNPGVRKGDEPADHEEVWIEGEDIKPGPLFTPSA